MLPCSRMAWKSWRHVMTRIRLVEERQSSLVATASVCGQATTCERRSSSMCERQELGSEYAPLSASVFEVLCSRRPLGPWTCSIGRTRWRTWGKGENYRFRVILEILLQFFCIQYCSNCFICHTNKHCYSLTEGHSVTIWQLKNYSWSKLFLFIFIYCLL
jgi:hypothetical protein